MKKSVKDKVAKMLSGNTNLNKKTLQMKKSWDEVDNLLKSAKTNTAKKKKE